MHKGFPVEVRSRFDGRWVSGFDVADVRGGQVWVRRRSDGVRIPVPFATGDVRERRETAGRL
jgi:hypothetical protein